MGNRGNILVKHGESSYVHVYTHFKGDRLPGVIRHVLSSDDMTIDVAYLTRLVVLAMGDDDDYSGVGISPRRQDNENDIFVIDPENREIQRWSAERYERWDEAPPIPGEKPLETWTFDAFKGG